jgi:hypothetical protein
MIFCLGFNVHADENSIFGVWHLLDNDEDTHVTSLYIKVEPDKVTTTSVCKRKIDGKSLSVTVTTPASVTSNSLTILSFAQNSKDFEGFDCTVTAEPFTLDFEIKNNGQTLHPLDSSLPDAKRVN